VRAPPQVWLLDADDTWASLATRAVLESYAEVRLVGIGTPAQFATALRNVPAAARLVILGAHGDDRGLLFPELTPALIPEQPFYPAAGADAIRRLAPLPPVPILSTACETGRAPLARAFLAAGCPGYVAPRGSPDGDAALMFALNAAYWFVARRRPLAEAVERARAADPRARTFRCWGKLTNR
jgi:hypothetical protein